MADWPGTGSSHHRGSGQPDRTLTNYTERKTTVRRQTWPDCKHCRESEQQSPEKDRILLKNMLAYQFQHGKSLKIQAIFRSYSSSGLSPDGGRDNYRSRANLA